MISLETAQSIAGQELKRRIEQSAFWSRYEMQPPILSRENERFWLFFSRSEELIEEGHAPGGLFIPVEKETGRVLTNEETERYYASQTTARGNHPAATNEPRPDRRVA